MAPKLGMNSFSENFSLTLFQVFHTSGHLMLNSQAPNKYDIGITAIMQKLIPFWQFETAMQDTKSNFISNSIYLL